MLAQHLSSSVASLLTSTSTMPSLTLLCNTWTWHIREMFLVATAQALWMETATPGTNRTHIEEMQNVVADATRSSGQVCWKSVARSQSATVCSPIPLMSSSTSA